MKNIIILLLLAFILIAAETGNLSIRSRSKEQIVLEFDYVGDDQVKNQITPYYEQGYRVVGMIAGHTIRDNDKVTVVMER